LGGHQFAWCRETKKNYQEINNKETGITEEGGIFCLFSATKTPKGIMDTDNQEHWLEGLRRSFPGRGTTLKRLITRGNNDPQPVPTPVEEKKASQQDMPVYKGKEIGSSKKVSV